MNAEVEEAKRVIRVAFANDTLLRRKYVYKIWAALSKNGIPDDMKSDMARQILDELFYDDELPPK